MIDLEHAFYLLSHIAGTAQLTNKHDWRAKFAAVSTQAEIAERGCPSWHEAAFNIVYSVHLAFDELHVPANSVLVAMQRNGEAASIEAAKQRCINCFRQVAESQQSELPSLEVIDTVAAQLGRERELVARGVDGQLLLPLAQSIEFSLRQAKLIREMAAIPTAEPNTSPKSSDKSRPRITREEAKRRFRLYASREESDEELSAWLEAHKLSKKEWETITKWIQREQNKPKWKAARAKDN